MKPDIPDAKHKRKKAQKNEPKKNVNVKWIVTIFLLTVLISAVFSMVSNVLLMEANLFSAFIILLVIVFIGIIFDIIGVAVTAADPKPFNSMAAHKVPGGKEALKMLKNAEKVSSFCNDVVGDICGIISGTASAAIVVLMLTGLKSGGYFPTVLEIAMAALVSGLTVGGKAVGKSLAMNQSTAIVHTAAKIVYFLKNGPQIIGKALRQKK